MSELDTVRLIGEVIAIAAFVMGGVAWLGRRIYAVHEAIKGVDGRLDTLNGTVSKHELKLQHHALTLARLEGKEEGRKETVAEAAVVATAAALHESQKENP